MKLLPKNWEKFQHYKHRSPPWIKLHRDILDDFDWWSLPIASRAIAPCLWLLASCEEDGEFDASPEKLAFRFRMTEKDIQLAIKPLIDKGYFICASDVLAPCYKDAMSEKSKSRDREANKLGWTAEQAVIHCCEKGWVSLDASWIAKDKPQSKSFKEDTMAAARSIFTNSSGIPYYQAKEIEVKND